MSTNKIPVDLRNPGQVVACMGFLEAADLLCGNARGAFDWSDPKRSYFTLEADGSRNAFEVVLDFLTAAKVVALEPPPAFMRDKDKSKGEKKPEANDKKADALETVTTRVVPFREGNIYRRPVVLEWGGRRINVGHWADASSREDFKLPAGTVQPCRLMRDLIREGLAVPWRERRDAILADPYGLTAIGTRFGFDPRSNWNAINAGFSLEDVSVPVRIYPLVEILAPIGLEHSRPTLSPGRAVAYAVWKRSLPPLLARSVFADIPTGIEVRRFRFVMEFNAKNKLFTIAEENRS